MAAKECRDSATIDHSGFFFQAKADDDDEPLIIKLEVSVALLLVESDEVKWKKNLRLENVKWETHDICSKIIYSALNAALITHKNYPNVPKDEDSS